MIRTSIFRRSVAVLLPVCSIAGLAQASVITTTRYAVDMTVGGETTTHTGATGKVTDALADLSGTQRAAVNVDSDVTIDDDGYLTFNNFSAAVGKAARVKSETFINQTITNTTGISQSARFESLIFAGFVEMFQPNFADPACDIDIAACSLADTYFFDKPQDARVDIEFQVRAGGRTVYDLQMWMGAQPTVVPTDDGDVTLMSEFNFAIHSDGGGETYRGGIGGIDVLTNYRQGTSRFNSRQYYWDDTYVSENIGILSPGEVLDLEIYSSVTATAGTDCGTTDTNCMAVMALFGDPFYGGSAGGGGIQEMRSFAMASDGFYDLSPAQFVEASADPRISVNGARAWQPTIYFSDPGDPSGTEFALNPEPLALEVPAPGAALLFGFAALGLAARRRSIA